MPSRFKSVSTCFLQYWFIKSLKDPVFHIIYKFRFTYIICHDLRFSDYFKIHRPLFFSSLEYSKITSQSKYKPQYCVFLKQYTYLKLYQWTVVSHKKIWKILTIIFVFISIFIIIINNWNILRSPRVNKLINFYPKNPKLLFCRIIFY